MASPTQENFPQSPLSTSPPTPTAPTSPQRYISGSTSTSPCRSLPEDMLDAMLYVRSPHSQHWGGYKLDLMRDPVSDDMICALCKGVAKESVQTIHCGAVCCKSCMEQAFAKVNRRRKKMSNPGFSHGAIEQIKIDCPKEGCSVRLPADGQFPDTRHQNQVSKLQVSCPLLHSRSCPWIGSLADLVSTHITECELIRIPCPVGCGLNELRGQIEWHLKERCGKRLVVCEYCAQHIESRLLNEHHASTGCSEYPIPCPNRCMIGDRRNILPRSQVADHLANVCPLATQQCPYINHGCLELPYREALQDHIDNSVPVHLDLVVKHCEPKIVECERNQADQAVAIEWIKKKLFDTSKSMNDSLMELDTKLDGKLEGFEKRLLEICNVVVKLQDKLTINNVGTPSSISPGEGDKFNSSTTKDKKNQTKQEEVEYLHEELQKANEENKRLKTFLGNYSKRVSQIEELNVWGNYTWVIKCVSEKFKLKQFIYSNPFYTSPSGYRVCVSVALNGFGPGEDTHIGLGLFMMRGKNDPYLSWPFAGSRKYILLNYIPGGKHYHWQNSDSGDKAFQRPMEERGETGHGCPQFISHEELLHETEEVQYLKDDTLIIRIIVKSNDTV
ncbi:TNF receptor-associated factor 5 [Oopsacas minuta]|uniref:TNF receptor-associated factor 5 n=1 Tax=Oopsacas minuta TaxID=111878 RepID=A0AAV7JUD7_9METZ|nr:TNF receptor-associated factor 5 [Oopsacas minuta]